MSERSGLRPGWEWVASPCPACGGEGLIRTVIAPGEMEHLGTCPGCRGLGKIVRIDVIRAVEQAVLAEREACARLADQHADRVAVPIIRAFLELLAEDIRDRGKSGGPGGGA